MTTEPNDRANEQSPQEELVAKDGNAETKLEDPRLGRSSIGSMRPAARGPRDRGSRF